MDDAKLRPGWFNELADFLGPAYLRNAFTKGTRQEVDYLVGALGLSAGSRVLDIGCGPGRHSLEFARRGISAVGVDLSPTFIELARSQALADDLDAVFVVADVALDDFGERVAAAAPGVEFDAAVCLCQGGFGLLGGAESPGLLRRFARQLKPNGRLAVSAFSAYFAVRWIEDGDDFDVATGVNHERATLRDHAGVERDFDLWTTCFTTRELRLFAESAGVEVVTISGVAPGDYATREPSFAHPELLLVAQLSPR